MQPYRGADSKSFLNFWLAATETIRSSLRDLSVSTKEVTLTSGQCTIRIRFFNRKCSSEKLPGNLPRNHLVAIAFMTL